jgi:maleylacetate reductase
MHTPENITEEAMKVAKELKADCVVSVGGGSTIGLGKAIAYRTDLPQIVVPTTYAGSEATPILGQTAGGQKTTMKSEKGMYPSEDLETLTSSYHHFASCSTVFRSTTSLLCFPASVARAWLTPVLPEVILYDVDLTLTLPSQMTVTSGMNAIAHAVEALYSPESNPMIDMLAEQGIAAIARALPIIHTEPGNKDARSDALFGAWACGTCLGAVGMSLHHKLCHTLGGSFNVPSLDSSHSLFLAKAFSPSQSRPNWKWSTE